MTHSATVLVLAMVCGFHVPTSNAFTTTKGASTLIGLKQECDRPLYKSQRSFRALYSSPDPDMPSEEGVYYESSSSSEGEATYTNYEVQESPSYYESQQAPVSNAPPPVRQPRMDPLMASLTRDNSNPDGPTQTVPIFGEIPADGTLLLLAPAVLFAFGGFLLSIVVAVQSADQIVDSLSQAGDSIAQTAAERTNRVYDESVCRGICNSQQDDIDGLRNFMEAITKSAREKN